MKVASEEKAIPAYDRANFLSKLFFAWVTPIFIKSYNRQLNENEIFDISYYDSSDFLTNTMQIEWNKELCGVKPNLARVVLRIFWKKYLWLGIILFIENCLNLCQPIIIWKLLTSVKSIHENFITPIIYSTILIITVALIILLRNPYYFYTLRIGMQVKVGISGLIYLKILKLNQKALGKTATGQIINLLSNDVQRFELGFPHLHYIWIGPIVTIIAIIILYLLSREGGVAGLVIFLILIPLQIGLGTFYNRLRSRVAVITDERIKMVSELINGMRVVKMYCWENMFIKVIGELRRQILFYGFLRKLSRALWVALRFSGGRFVTLALLITVTLCRISAHSRTIWVSVIFINQIRSTIIDRLSLSVSHFVDMRISFLRVQNFLTLSELNDNVDNGMLTSSPLSSINSLTQISDIKVTFENVTASWNKVNKDDNELTLKNISFSLRLPQICAIIGEVGSGKSSLLMALLGELPLSSGQIIVSGSIAYVSQQPWVFSGTIQDNVLFNVDFNEKKLIGVLEATTLDQDIKKMPLALETLVGERGVSLSGGQKSRISLARAAYRESSVILLDDPLAAVDTQVGHKIFFDCIVRLFKNKLVLLVTHQIHLLEHVDQILVLKDGTLLDIGTLSEIKSRGLDVNALLNNKGKDKNLTLADLTIRDSAYLNPLEKTDVAVNKNESNRFSRSLNRGTIPLIVAYDSPPSEQVINDKSDMKCQHQIVDKLEGYAGSQIGFKIYWIYFTAGVSAFAVLLVMILYSLTMLLYIFCDIWLSWWTQEMDNRNMTADDFYDEDSSYMMGLIILTISNFCIGFISVVSIFMICISSSRVLHNKMLISILNAPMSFFDITPAGRILNRFSKDVGIIDDLMPLTIQDLILTSSLVIFGVGLSLFKNYWCIIIVVPLFILFWLMRHSYLNVSRTIKRIEAATRSPLFDHISNTIQGLTTIRACRSQLWFINSFYRKQDRHSKAFFLYISASRWFAFRLDEVCMIFITGVTYSCLGLLYYKTITVSDFGLILTYVIGFIGLTQWAVRQSTEVENQMISVERIYEYSNLQSERFICPDQNDPVLETWPSTGKIQFEDATFFYNVEGPLILDKVNLVIEDKEKIGIVGRTGAGKSSLISALFRLIELPLDCGRILIDNRDIEMVGLSQLRNSIAVIPQDPVLFMGDIRRNLDPFNEFDDKTLWGVLDTVELKETIYKMPDQLYSAVSEGGSNISVGQRQLLCMARALLKKTRIIVIDEATANVDPHTDRLIQRTLKTTFTNCTVLTIAHRLNTIVDSDKILVMSDGRVAQFDHPHILLTEHPQAIFAQLVKQTGNVEEMRLKKEAEANYLNRKSNF